MTLPPDSLLSRDPLRLTRNRLLTRTVAPVSEPITLTEAKLYLRVDSANEDTLINDLIVAARMIAESWIKKSLLTQTWKIAFDDGIAQSTCLPMGPVSSIVSVLIVNQDGSTQTISSSTYWLDAAQTSLIINTVLIGYRIEITYLAGYGDETAVPKPIKLGMLEHIAAMYDSRGQSGEMSLPEHAAGLYMPFREVRV